MQSGPCQAQTNLPAAGTNQHRLRGLKVGCGHPDGGALPAGPSPDRLITAGTALRPHRRQCPDRTGAPEIASAGRAADRARPRRDRHAFLVLIGNTADEFTLFVATRYLDRKGLPPYRTLLTDTFRPRRRWIAAHHPLDRYDGSTALAYAAAVTDGVFACPIDVYAAGLAAGAGPRSTPTSSTIPPRRRPNPCVTLLFRVGAGTPPELRYLSTSAARRP